MNRPRRNLRAETSVAREYPAPLCGCGPLGTLPHRAPFIVAGRRVCIDQLASVLCDVLGHDADAHLAADQSSRA